MYQSNINIPYYYENMYQNQGINNIGMNRQASFYEPFRRPPRPIGRPPRPIGRPPRPNNFFGGGFILPFALGFLSAPLIRPQYPPYYPPYPYQSNQYPF